MADEYESEYGYSTRSWYIGRVRQECLSVQIEWVKERGSTVGMDASANASASVVGSGQRSAATGQWSMVNGRPAVVSGAQPTPAFAIHGPWNCNCNCNNNARYLKAPDRRVGCRA